MAQGHAIACMTSVEEISSEVDSPVRCCPSRTSPHSPTPPGRPPVQAPPLPPHDATPRNASTAGPPTPVSPHGPLPSSHMHSKRPRRAIRRRKARQRPGRAPRAGVMRVVRSQPHQLRAAARSGRRHRPCPPPPAAAAPVHVGARAVIGRRWRSAARCRRRRQSCAQPATRGSSAAGASRHGGAIDRPSVADARPRRSTGRGVAASRRRRAALPASAPIKRANRAKRTPWPAPSPGPSALSPRRRPPRVRWPAEPPGLPRSASAGAICALPAAGRAHRSAPAAPVFVSGLPWAWPVQSHGRVRAGARGAQVSGRGSPLPPIPASAAAACGRPAGPRLGRDRPSRGPPAGPPKASPIGQADQKYVTPALGVSPQGTSSSAPSCSTPRCPSRKSAIGDLMPVAPPVRETQGQATCGACEGKPGLARSGISGPVPSVRQ